jgi:hypothetical protein
MKKYRGPRPGMILFRGGPVSKRNQPPVLESDKPFVVTIMKSLSKGLEEGDGVTVGDVDVVDYSFDTFLEAEQFANSQSTPDGLPVTTEILHFRNETWMIPERSEEQASR